jgi:hypothetical protein
MFIRKELFQSLRNEFYYRDETQTKQKKSQILSLSKKSIK